MTWAHGSRFIVHLVSQLAAVYRRALVFGFVCGLFGSLAFIRLLPLVGNRFLRSTDRIGIVGGYTPTTLPIAIQNLISTGLTTLAPDGGAASGLAASWEAASSGTVYLFHLRSDARWHTGRPVSAADVNYNIRNVTFTAENPTTLRVQLKEAYSPFPTLVVKPIFTSGLVGFGPYRVDTIRLKGDVIVLLRLVPVDVRQRRVKEYRFYQTEAAAAIGFKRGEVDILEEVSSPNALARWGNITTTSQPSYDRVVALFFNTKVPKLSQRSFRQALSYAVPELPHERADSPFPKNSWTQTTNLRSYTYNEEQAQKFLKAAVDATSSGSFTIATFAPFVHIAETIAKSWSSQGVPFAVKVVNDLSGGFDVLLTAQRLPPDPDQYPFWHSTQKDTNITGYANAKIDKLLEDGRRESDREKRKKIYADFARRLTEDAPVRYLYYPKTYTIRRKR